MEGLDVLNTWTLRRDEKKGTRQKKERNEFLKGPMSQTSFAVKEERFVTVKRKFWTKKKAHTLLQDGGKKTRAQARGVVSESSARISAQT